MAQFTHAKLQAARIYRRILVCGLDVEQPGLADQNLLNYTRLESKHKLGTVIKLLFSIMCLINIQLLGDRRDADLFEPFCSIRLNCQLRDAAEYALVHMLMLKLQAQVRG